MDPPASRRPTWLRAADQWGAALVISIALVGMGALHWWQGGWQRGLIEIESAAPIVVEYKVDINRASATEFLVLPEIGEALAQAIVDERTRNGPFRDHSDLRRVRGIGPKTLERIRPYLLPMPEAGEVAGK